jgi:hypothetical protein
LSVKASDSQRRMIRAMSKDEPPKGKPVAIDRDAASASQTEPAFVTPSKGAPVYHGFVVLEDVNVDGFTLGAITDFEAERCDAGDAFIIAPDGSRAGLVWEVSATAHVVEVRPFEQSRAQAETENRELFFRRQWPRDRPDDVFCSAERRS